MTSTSDLVSGIVTVLLLLVFAAAVATRVLSGRLFVPKREIILPNQLGVLVQGSDAVRVAGPGSCWVRPKQRLVLIDARPKPIQLVGFEVLGSDKRVVRLSLSGEYKVEDAAVFYSNSANAADAVYVQLRRIINLAARQLPGAALAGSPQAFSARVLNEIAESARRLGLIFTQLDVYEAVPLGYLQVPDEPAMTFPSSGLVH